MKFKAFVMLSIFFFTPSFAASASQQTEAKYEDIVKTLSAQHQAILEKIDAQIVHTFDPKYAIQIMDTDYKTCVANNSEFAKNSTFVANHHYLKNKEHYQNKKRLDKNIDSINFIDKNVFYKHINTSINIQKALVQGLSEAAVQAHLQNGTLNAHCENIGATLKNEYAGDHIQHLDVTPTHDLREIKKYNLKSCSYQFRYVTADNKKLSVAFIFNNPDGKIAFDTSATIRDENDERLPVENFWINFGDLDTRKDGNYLAPYPELLIANIPKEKVIEALELMNEKPATMAIKAKGWDKEIVFTNNKIALEDLQKMAACVTAIDLSLIEKVETSTLFKR